VQIRITNCKRRYIKKYLKRGNRMPNLFMVMLGGRHARANTEVHDVVFAVGDSLEDTYTQLKMHGLVNKKAYILMLGCK
jgi:translation initiation factor IF-3